MDVALAVVAAVLGAAAAAVALVTFFPWALERRRRPEVEVRWLLSDDDDQTHVTAWEPGTVREVKGGAMIVEASLRNAGDASADGTRTNFVVRADVGLEAVGDDVRSPRFAADGTPTGCNFVPCAFDLPPGEWKQQRFRLSLPTEDDLDLRLHFVISGGRFNATGRRWLPSRLTDGEVAHGEPGSPWPPPGEDLRWWQPSAWTRARALPPGRILCRRGLRADVRDLRVVPDRRPAAG